MPQLDNLKMRSHRWTRLMLQLTLTRVQDPERDGQTSKTLQRDKLMSTDRQIETIATTSHVHIRLELAALHANRTINKPIRRDHDWRSIAMAALCMT